MRAFRQGMSPVRAGLIALVIIVVATFFAFSKDIPFTQTYRIQAVFENSNLVAPRSPVRIAGIDVGKVIEVERYKDTDMSVVTMEITDDGRPVGEDATVKVRQRLFLEGNFFLDLKPGTPGAEELPDGGMIPVAQTSSPVQLDQVLTTLQADTRRNLQDTIVGFGEALDSEPTAADDADQDPDVRGLTGAQALNKAFETGVPALKGSAIAAESLRGTEARDLSRLVEGVAGVSRGLAQNETQLSEFLTDFNTTMAATASRAPQLEETVRLLGPTASNLRRGLASIEAALPPTQEFSRAILPGVRETPITVAASEPWLDQAIPFFGAQELGGLLKQISPATRDLASATHESRPLVRESDDFNRCITEVIIPTGNIKVDDGEFSSNTENYKEFWHAVAGQAGEGGGFDGNGPFLRLSAPGGSLPITSGKTNYQEQALHANASQPLLRSAPAYPNSLPPLRRDVPCHRNPVPDVNGSFSVGPPDGSRANAASPPVPPRGIGAQLKRDVEREAAASQRLVPLESLLDGGAR
ncbi:MAG TPA: MlaD family protein [Thermoleophilaceae bacterium]|nr:MlaD family protein [Thermoleophilaceae bacterium]